MKIVGDDPTHKCHHTADMGAIEFMGDDALNCPNVAKCQTYWSFSSIKSKILEWAQQVWYFFLRTEQDEWEKPSRFGLMLVSKSLKVIKWSFSWIIGRV